MAKKNWEKSYNANQWFSIAKRHQQDSGLFHHRYTISVHYNYGKNKWYVEIYDIDENKSKYSKFFKSKSQALKFAKNYMRKH